MEGLIYVGTDDGLVQVTEDGGKTWRRTDKFGSFPDGIYVTSVRASPRDANVVFATLNNWQRGDFKPYVVRSDDRGKTFTSITGDLPTRMDAFSIVQDHVNSNLLFVGAEFGLFFTVDGGQHWVQLKGGLPTIQVRDLAIQKRENDLVLGTFGRGFYVLDDYSALRDVTPEALGRDAELFPLRRVYGFDELTYIQAAWGNYTTPNPPNGATFTYHVGPSNAGNLVLTIADEGGKDLCRMDIPRRPLACIASPGTCASRSPHKPAVAAAAVVAVAVAAADGEPAARSRVRRSRRAPAPTRRRSLPQAARAVLAAASVAAAAARPWWRSAGTRPRSVVSTATR